MANRASAIAQKRKRPDEETAAGAAAMCVNGCGFFGAAATGNMCSKCYREHVTTTADADADATDVTSVFAAAASTAPPEKKAKVCVSVTSSDDAAAAAVDLSSSALLVTALEQPACAKPATAAANRCLTCRRKVGLTGFRCRCEGTFCSVHRYSDKHDCGYDYKSAGREQIAKQNPIVVADKIVRI